MVGRGRGRLSNGAGICFFLRRLSWFAIVSGLEVQLSALWMWIGLGRKRWVSVRSIVQVCYTCVSDSRASTSTDRAWGEHGGHRHLRTGQGGYDDLAAEVKKLRPKLRVWDAGLLSVVSW